MADAAARLDRISVALVQAELRWQDPSANREHLSALMDRQPGADLYLLPEAFSTGFLGDLGSPAETLDGPTVAWMREQAKKRSALLAGSLALEVDGARRNRMLVVDADGLQAHYDKRHLFGFGGEGDRYRAGDRHSVLEWRGWRMDLQICYDLRFPVWCRNARDFDVQLFVANWPRPRKEAWRSLLKARAIENQSYVIGVNCTGTHGNGIEYPGCSSAWSPMGECLIELDDTEALAMVELDRPALRDLRRQFPFLADGDMFSIQPPSP
jgi:predicted amidohydrolase